MHDMAYAMSVIAGEGRGRGLRHIDHYALCFALIYWRADYVEKRDDRLDR